MRDLRAEKDAEIQALRLEKDQEVDTLKSRIDALERLVNQLAQSR